MSHDIHVFYHSKKETKTIINSKVAGLNQRINIVRETLLTMLIRISINIISKYRIENSLHENVKTRKQVEEQGDGAIRKSWNTVQKCILQE